MKMEHYFTKKPTSHLQKKNITTIIKGKQITLTTAAGVFSKQKIDLGTRILIENSVIKPNTKVLDLGCGYGVVGITIAKTIPDVQIVMTDVNERATKLAQENAQLNNVIVEVKTGNSYEPVNDETFDYILLNPPQTAGRELCFQLIEQSPKHLNKGGTFYIVARHQKGGKVIEEKMKTVFGNVETVARESGFRVYKSAKSKKSP